MKVRSKTLGIMMVGIFAVGIGTSMAIGSWRTTGSRTPARYASGAFAGISDPSDIRGSYSFSDVSRSFDVSVETLGRAFGVSGFERLESFQAKDLEAIYGKTDEGEIGTDSLRLFVARYLGLPYAPENDTLLPRPALQILADRVTPDELSELEERSINIAGLKNDEAIQGEHTESSDDRFIRGKTTFGDLRSWGVTDEELVELLGFEPGKDGESIRDVVFDNGGEFGMVKTKLQELVDSK
jgi:hypothetical protein